MHFWSWSRIGRTALSAALTTFAIAALPADFAQAQLRIVSYNTTGDPATGMDIILRSIGEESINGIAKPIDVLLLQEQSPDANHTDTQAFVDLLNTMYAGQMHDGKSITYARGSTIAQTSFNPDTTQSIVYRVQTVDLLSDTAIGSVSGSTQPRQTLKYKLRPDGYDATADFYAYNSHYKASQDTPPSTTNQDRRNLEAITIRNDSNGLGSAHIIYAGDHNFYTAAEPAFQTLLAPGNGKAIDPLGLTDPTPDADPSDAGDWHDNGLVAFAHTQSPCSSSVGSCSVGGGMDDRFDFQLMTEEFDDSEGLDFINGSYRAFGNKGVSLNTSINNATNLNAATGYAFNGVTTYNRTQILGALHTATDHIPVVADYQVPAILNALAGTVPQTLDLGELFNLPLMVNNAADVVAQNGADELDYSVTTMGAVSGEFLNQIDLADPTIQIVNTHQLALDTALLGFKTGTITVQSPSQAVMNSLVQIPVSYWVQSGLPGDYNSDGFVDAVDYTVWRNNFGASDEFALAFQGDGGDVGETDFELWKMHYGDALDFGAGGGSGGSSPGPVPEPATWLLVSGCLGCCLGSWRLGTLRAWNRATQKDATQNCRA